MITKLLTLLLLMFSFDYNIAVLDRPYRCDGDLIKFEMDKWINELEESITRA